MSLLKAPYLSAPLSTPLVELASGETWVIGPEAGFYLITVSRNHTIQVKDPISGLWLAIGTSVGSGGGKDGISTPMPIYSDGVNYRIANQTGCPVGALLHTAGSGYTSVPTVTDSATAATWKAIVGGAVSTTVTVTAAGTNYTYPPLVVFSPPPAGGLMATGYATLSGTTVGSITVTQQGAGYISPPTVTLINDPRELSNPLLTVGYGALATAALTGAQTVTAVVVTDHGAGGVTSLPTLTFTGGGGSSAVATVIMNWSITSIDVTAGGGGFIDSSSVEVSGLDAFPTASAAYTNAKYQSGLVGTRKASILAPVTSGGAMTTGSPPTGYVLYDGGCYTSVPTPLVATGGAAISSAPTITFSMGGVGGASYVWQIG